MTATDIHLDNPDRTLPPISVLRRESPWALYQHIPQLARLTRARPEEHEDEIAYTQRLLASAVPEDAVLYAAFATTPKPAIWWGYECLRQIGIDTKANDREMMASIALWTQNPSAENRFRAMRLALYAPERTASVHLGLAVGWSGGPIGPNDRASDTDGVPAHRAPQAVATAVLSALAGVPTARRGAQLKDCVEQAMRLFRVY